MFDFSTVIQQVFATISDLFVNQILGLVTGLFGRLFG